MVLLLIWASLIGCQWVSGVSDFLITTILSAALAILTTSHSSPSLATAPSPSVNVYLEISGIKDQSN